MKPWKDWTDEEIEQFISDNKDKFDRYLPEPKHEEKFLKKLSQLIKKTVISIVPHLIKVIIVMIIIWTISFALWYFFDLPTLWGLFWKWIN